MWIKQQFKYLILWIIPPAAGIFIYPLIESEPEQLKWMGSGILLYTLFFSVVVHELCHGLAADFCGDSTARDAGRLTLNPIPHVSVVGTILVPLTLYFINVKFMFGWAKGVPFNTRKLKSYPRDQVFLSVAGPLSNFALCALCLIFYLLAGFICNRIYPDNPYPVFVNLFSPAPFASIPYRQVWFVLSLTLLWGALINLVLGVINLIPFPPLDGSWVLKALLPQKAKGWMSHVQTYGFFLFFIIVFSGFLSLFMYPIIGLSMIFMHLAQAIISS